MVVFYVSSGGVTNDAFYNQWHLFLWDIVLSTQWMLTMLISVWVEVNVSRYIVKGTLNPSRVHWNNTLDLPKVWRNWLAGISV